MDAQYKKDLDGMIEEVTNLLVISINDNDVSAIDFFRNKAAKLVGERKLADFGVQVIR